MFKGRLRNVTCMFLCLCMIVLNIPPVGAMTGNPDPGDKPPKKSAPKKKPPAKKPPLNKEVEKPGKEPKLDNDVNARIIEYVKNLKTKDVMIPVFAQLSQRHLDGATDTNELDIAFSNAIRKFPNIEKRLPDFVSAYNAIPANLKKQKFVMPNVQKGGKATNAAISTQSLSSSIAKVYPDIMESPAQIAYNKRQTVTKNIYKEWKGDPFGDTEVAQIDYVEKPRITHLTPTGREPGESINIYGQNFQSGKTHKIAVTFKDIENADPEIFENTATSSSQIVWDIPEDFIPGSYSIQIQAPGMLMVGPGENHTPISDPGTYEVSVPKYKVYFNKMKCIDETRGPNNENIYQDSLVTFFAIGADERGWFKHSKKYQYFKDGSMHPYDDNDKLVLTPDDNWNKVQYGMVVSVDLYEWNWTAVESGDSDEILDFAYCFFEEFYESNAWGDNLVGMLFNLLALLITPLIDMWVNLFTADPRHIENETLEFSAMDLQTMLEPGKSTTGKLNFWGQDGEYDLYYSIHRQ